MRGTVCYLIEELFTYLTLEVSLTSMPADLLRLFVPLNLLSRETPLVARKILGWRYDWTCNLWFGLVYASSWLPMIWSNRSRLRFRKDSLTLTMRHDHLFVIVLTTPKILL